MSAVILIVDDDRSVRTSLARLLRAHAHEVIEVASAEEAISTAVREQPDVIVMDLHMPNGTGVDAARALRGHAALTTRPIIALTATLPDDRETNALFDAVLEKPCSAVDLVAAIEEALRP